MRDFKNETKMKIINNHHPRAHFIVFNSSLLVFTFWKGGETSSTTSLLLIRPSSNHWIRDNSVFNSSGSSLCPNGD